MTFNPVATNKLTHRSDNLQDWVVADPGQWFIGVIDTDKRNVYVVPVNVFEGRGQLNQETLDNTNQRAVNRYASGPRSSPASGGGKEQRGLSYKSWASFDGPEGNWLEGRQVGLTHHSATAVHYGADPKDCLGFTLIKVSNKHFAQIKCSSNSLNGNKPNYRVLHSFSRSTSSNLDRGPSGFADISPGSAQMPIMWMHALRDYLRGAPFNLIHVVVSND